MSIFKEKLQEAKRADMVQANPYSPIDFVFEERQLAELARTKDEMRLFKGGTINKFMDALSIGSFAQVAVTRKVLEGAGVLNPTDKGVWELMQERKFNTDLLSMIGNESGKGGIFTGQYDATESFMYNFVRELPRATVGVAADIFVDPLTYLSATGVIKRTVTAPVKKVSPMIKKVPALQKSADFMKRNFVPAYLRQPKELRQAVVSRKIAELEAYRKAAEQIIPMEGMSRAMRERVSQVVRGGITTRKDIQDMAEPIRKLIDNLGGSISKKAPQLLDETIYLKNKGTYLGTFYTKHLDDTIIEPAFIPLKSKLKVPIDRFRHKKDFTGNIPDSVKTYLDSTPDIRNKVKSLVNSSDFKDTMFKTSSGSAETTESVTSLAKQMKDIFPGYNTKEITQAIQLDSFLKGNSQMISPSDFFAQSSYGKFSSFFNEKVRKSLGQINEITLPGYKTISNLGIADARLDFYGKIARDKNLSSSLPFDNWDKLPVDKRLGQLSGKYVAPDIMEELQTITRRTTQLEGIWGKGLRVWKGFKTAYNPATIARNDITNLTILNPLGGLPPYRIDIYNKAFKEFRRKGELLKRAEKVGLSLSSQEVAELKTKATKLYLRDSKETGIIKEFYPKVGDFHEKVLNFYGSQDRYFKLANFIKGVTEDGLSDFAAMQRANFYLINYADMPAGIEFLRRQPLGAPFISFAYGVSLPLAKTLVSEPHKLSNMFKILNGIRTLNPYQIDRETIYAEQDDLPDWIKRKPTLRLPWKDAEGNTLYLDLEYIMPFNVFETRNIMPLQGPYADMMVAFVMNRDPFLGNPIVDDGDSFLEAAEKASRYVYRVWAPSLAPGGFGSERLMRALREEPERISETPRGKISAIADVFGGLRTFPINPAVQSKRNASQTYSEIQSIRSRIRSIQRDISKGFISKDEGDVEIQKHLERIKNILSQ